MGTPLERREREKHELRTKILDAARELFITDGYDAVTMRKVADKIEYSPTAIYLHFKDKDALIAELCTYDFIAFAERFLEAATIADPIERLRETGWIYFRFAEQHPQQYRLMFMTPPPPGPHPTPSDDPAENAYAFLLGTVRQALEGGRLRPDLDNPELVAQNIWASLHGVISLEIAKGKETGWIHWQPIEARVGAMIDLVIRGLIRDPAAPKSARAAEARKTADRPPTPAKRSGPGKRTRAPTGR